MSTQTANTALPFAHAGMAFDAIAREYDRIFTHSLLGRAQRSLVHEALQGHFRAGQYVLDLNCGTGEDALHLASQGMSVVACDASRGMIEAAQKKAAGHVSAQEIEFAVCANENLNRLQRY